MAKNTRPFIVWSRDNDFQFSYGSKYKVFYGRRKARREALRIPKGYMERTREKHGKIYTTEWYANG